MKDSEWGFTGIFAKENGGGFLTDHFPKARKAVWDYHGIYASSPQIPGVEFAGIMHPGLIGCLPSKKFDITPCVTGPKKYLDAMRPENRIAWERNERNAHAPHVCGSGCSHDRVKPKSRISGDEPDMQASTKRNSRPWMLGH